MTQEQDAARLESEWGANPRWEGVTRDYSAADVIRLRGSFVEDHTISRLMAEKLWELLTTRDYVHALGAMSGGQAVQMVKAGLEAIYLSGWQVAGDANLADQVYPDQSLYPANSAPALVRRIVNALRRADQVHWAEGDHSTDWMVPIVADGEAGFGGALNVFELTKSFIEAGAAGVHFEDQLSSEKKCGHMGGKVLVPTAQHVRALTAARLAADVSGVPTLIVARTDANSANLLTSDIDPADRPFCTGARTDEGFFEVRAGLDQAIARGLAYAPYADLLWCETSHPDLEEAATFAEAVHQRFPDKMLAYNCSPSFNWRRHLDDDEIARFQKELGAHGVQIPVHHARRLPRHQRLDVRPGQWVQPRRDAGVCAAPGVGVCPRTSRVHRHPAPEGGRGRLLRPGGDRDRHRQSVDPRPGRVHRRGAILTICLSTEY